MACKKFPTGESSKREALIYSLQVPGWRYRRINFKICFEHLQCVGHELHSVWHKQHLQMHSPEGLMLEDRLERGPTSVMKGCPGWDDKPGTSFETWVNAKIWRVKENWRKIFKFCFILSKLFKCCWECGQDSNRMYHWLEREKVLIYGKMLRCTPPKIKWYIICSSKSIFGYTQGKERCEGVLKQVFINCISISRLFTISKIYKKFINR